MLFEMLGLKCADRETQNTYPEIPSFSATLSLPVL